MSTAEDAAPLKAAEIRSLFADLADHPVLVLAVSGGPDSTALLVLAGRWRKALEDGPKLIAVTVDHGLRPEARHEASAVKRLARSLGVAHRTLRWTGRKPEAGLQQAARNARYRLLGEAARKAGARHVLTAHTLDDQAETVLIRLVRGSGLSGLAAMARSAPLPKPGRTPSPLKGEGWGGGYTIKSAHEQLPPSRRASRVDLPLKGGGEKAKSSRDAHDQVLLVRPLLDVPKSRLLATLRKAGIAYADDPTNRDPRFTRARLRAAMPVLEREGLVPRRLALLARRVRRAEAALQAAVAQAIAELAPEPWPDQEPLTFPAGRYAELPAEVALRLLGQAVAWAGNEGPVELGKLEALYADLTATSDAVRFRRTLAGALITRTADRLWVERAPARRGAASKRP